MRLLLVEDDARIGQFAVEGLEQEGHVVDWSRDGEEGLRWLGERDYDAAAVDVSCRDATGSARSAKAGAAGSARRFWC